MTTRDGAAPLDRIWARLLDEAEQVGVSLVNWHGGTDKAAARRAGSDAVDALDRMLAIIHAGRAALIDELRAADEQAGKETDEILARIREQRAAMTETGDMLDELRRA